MQLLVPVGWTCCLKTSQKKPLVNLRSAIPFLLPQWKMYVCVFSFYSCNPTCLSLSKPLKRLEVSWSGHCSQAGWAQPQGFPGVSMLLPIQQTLGWEWRHQYIRPLKHISVCSKTCIVKMYSIYSCFELYIHVYTLNHYCFLQDLGTFRADIRSKHRPNLHDSSLEPHKRIVALSRVGL